VVINSYMRERLLSIYTCLSVNKLIPTLERRHKIECFFFVLFFVLFFFFQRGKRERGKTKAKKSNYKRGCLPLLILREERKGE
jgi:hypothetical protein